METVYLICFGVGLLFAVISAFFADVFGGHDLHAHVADSHAEGGFGASEMPGFSPLSPTTLAAFVTGFGGFGMLFNRWEVTKNPYVSAPLAALAGFVVAFGVFVLFRKVFTMTQSSSEARASQLVGTSATIITPIPLSGVGEIAYVLAGSRYTAPARTEDGTSAPGGTTVRITRVVGAQCFVRPT
jgi:membrane protein implicated in regulation of membrane protease activity